jgi:hypothetical protein
MITNRKPQLNFASHPLRNSKFFSLLLILLVSILFIILAGSAWTFFKYRDRAVSARSSINKMNKDIKTIRMDENRLESLITGEKSSKQAQVELVNRIIYRKSFSWMGFFAHLEELLPESCYVLSLDPTLNNGKRVRVNFRVASPSLNDLLVLVSRLDKQGFSEIRVDNETTLEDGYLVWDLSYTYEKTI